MSVRREASVGSAGTGFPARSVAIESETESECGVGWGAVVAVAAAPVRRKAGGCWTCGFPAATPGEANAFGMDLDADRQSAMVAVQSRSGRPLMSTASDPHMPCPQEYRKFSVGSTSRLICRRASRTVRCGAIRIVYSCVQRRPRARRLPVVAKGLLLANGLVRAGRSD